MVANKQCLGVPHLAVCILAGSHVTLLHVTAWKSVKRSPAMRNPATVPASSPTAKAELTHPRPLLAWQLADSLCLHWQMTGPWAKTMSSCGWREYIKALRLDP